MPGSDDVAYHPAPAGGWSALDLPVRGCLVLGDPPLPVLAEAERLGATVRIADGRVWSPLLRRGSYVVRDGDSSTVLVVVDGLEPTPALRGRAKFLEGDLPMAALVLKREWPDARPAHTSAAVAEGDVVRVLASGTLGTVRRVTAHMGEFDVVVDLPAGLRTFDGAALERVEGDPRDPEFWVSQPPGWEPRTWR